MLAQTGAAAVAPVVVALAVSVAAAVVAADAAAAAGVGAVAVEPARNQAETAAAGPFACGPFDPGVALGNPAGHAQGPHLALLGLAVCAGSFCGGHCGDQTPAAALDQVPAAAAAAAVPAGRTASCPQAQSPQSRGPSDAADPAPKNGSEHLDQLQQPGLTSCEHHTTLHRAMQVTSMILVSGMEMIG